MKLSLDATTIYIAVTLIVGVILILRAYIGIHRTARARLKALDERRRFDAVRTHSPVDDPYEVAHARGQQSIEQHFTVSRRLVIPILLVMTVAAVALPLLRDVSAVFVSLVATAVTVLLGIAARPAVENAIAGLVLSKSRLIRIGDTVRIDELYGTIEDITLTHTTIKIWDWRRYVVPNNRMLQSPMINHSLFDRYEWAYIEFWVDYEADVALVEKLAKEAMMNSPGYAPHEPPRTWVMELGPTGYRCWVAAWANSPSDAWTLKAAARARLLTSFRRHAIRPHRYHYSVDQPAPASAGDGSSPRTPAQGTPLPGPLPDSPRPHR